MTITTYLLMSIALIIVLSFFFRGRGGNKAYEEISAEDLKSMLKDKDVQLIDVRTSAETRSGVIGKPHKIELSSSFGKDVQKLNKHKKYVLYCRSGRRSAMACNMMTKLGFKHVYNLKGGYNAWTA